MRTIAAFVLLLPAVCRADPFVKLTQTKTTIIQPGTRGTPAKTITIPEVNGQPARSFTVPAFPGIPPKTTTEVFQASGTVIWNRNGASYILSCAHGKLENETVEISQSQAPFNKSKAIVTYRGEIVEIDHTRDLSLITCSLPASFKPFTLAESSPAEPGQRVRIMGFGHGQEHEKPTFTVRKYRYRDFALIKTQGTIFFGDSGGALVQGGKLVGVMKGTEFKNPAAGK